MSQVGLCEIVSRGSAVSSDSFKQVSSPFLLTVGRILDLDPMSYVGIVLIPTV